MNMHNNYNHLAADEAGRARLWADCVHQTRRYGSCYCPVVLPVQETIGEISYSQASYGRSWEGGGHKSKAYAHVADGRVASSARLFGDSDSDPRNRRPCCGPGRSSPAGDRTIYTEAHFGLSRTATGQLSADGGATPCGPIDDELIDDIEYWRGGRLTERELADLHELVDCWWGD